MNALDVMYTAERSKLMEVLLTQVVSDIITSTDPQELKERCAALLQQYGQATNDLNAAFAQMQQQAAERQTSLAAQMGIQG